MFSTFSHPNFEHSFTQNLHTVPVQEIGFNLRKHYQRLKDSHPYSKISNVFRENSIKKTYITKDIKKKEHEKSFEKLKVQRFSSKLKERGTKSKVPKINDGVEEIFKQIEKLGSRK